MSATKIHLGNAAANRGVRLGALALLLVGIPGCQSIDVTGTNVAQLRVIDASPDAGGLDFYQNKVALVYNVGFGSVTSYVPMTPGNYTISVDTAGSNQQLVSAGQTLVSGQQYTALVGNVAASLQETILTDQNGPAPTGQIYFRFIDQATKIGAVDIYLIPSSGKLITTNPFLTGVTFGVNTGYLTAPVGTYAVAIVPTGTVPLATTVTLYTSGQVVYASSSVHTLVLVDEQITTTPAVQVITAIDYDPPGATT